MAAINPAALHEHVVHSTLMHSFVWPWQTLCLNKNSLRSKGVASLAVGCGGNLYITTLQLTDNSIGAAGAAALLAMMRINRAIGWIM